MIPSGASASAKGLAILALATALAACGAQKSRMTDVQREDAERQELVDAMKNHPAFDEGADGNAVGKPITIPVTVPPKAEEGDAHDNHPPPAQPQ